MIADTLNSEHQVWNDPATAEFVTQNATGPFNAARLPQFATISIGYREPSGGFAGYLTKAVIKSSASLSSDLRKRIEDLSELQANWDGEGAKAVKSTVLADTVELLKRLSDMTSDFHPPFLAPTFEGFVQIEWHGTDKLLEFEALRDGWSVIGTKIRDAGHRDYLVAECKRSDFESLKNFYDWYLGIELVWPQSSR